jgi:hypothetical protein
MSKILKNGKKVLNLKKIPTKLNSQNYTKHFLHLIYLKNYHNSRKISIHLKPPKNLQKTSRKQRRNLLKTTPNFTKKPRSREFSPKINNFPSLTQNPPFHVNFNSNKKERKIVVNHDDFPPLLVINIACGGFLCS